MTKMNHGCMHEEKQLTMCMLVTHGSSVGIIGLQKFVKYEQTQTMSDAKSARVSGKGN